MTATAQSQPGAGPGPLSPTHLNAFQSASSTRNYRHSALVEQGDYHAHSAPQSPQTQYSNPQSNLPRSSFDLDQQQAQGPSGAAPGSANVGLGLTQGQGQPPGAPQGRLTSQRHVPRMPSMGTLERVPSSSSSSGGTSGGISRSVSINDPMGRANSSNRMVYSPNPPPQDSLNSPSWQTARPDSSSLLQYRASPSNPQQQPPPQPGLMRRGMSFDGSYANPTTAPGAPQQGSLLPTAYASRGAPPPPSYSGGGGSPNSALPGVARTTADYNPSSSPSTSRPPALAHSPSAQHLFQPQQQQLGQGLPSSSGSHGPLPVVQAEHNRHASYSPSHYAAQSANPVVLPPPPATSMPSQQPAPSPAPSHYTPAPASSFYPQHIVTASQPPPPPPSLATHQLPPPPPPPSSSSSTYQQQPPSAAHPPPQSSSTPSHQPQAQQYYQSQQYYDSTLQSSSASVAAAAGNPNAAVAAQYYAGGDSLRSASAVYAPGATGTGPNSVGPGAAPGGGGGGSAGFRKVRDVREIKRTINAQPAGRRADPAGGFISPLRALTTNLPQTYNLVNPSFHYETSLNPRRVLTKPSKPAQNGGFDNEDSDYILYVNDVLGPEEKDRYLILDVLGQGTFGQVVKCQNMKTHEIVAVKVVKNKPAYFQQSMMEVTILELINNQWDKDDEHHMLRLKDTFIHQAHLCLVFELLSNNLYELIKQNSFRGLSTSLVRVFTAQLLDALTVLQEAKIIHCDLKPENILLKSLQSPTIKVIDFGSACHEKQTVYTYIQSRFYRSPEVILSLPYSASIDMWSLGCICVELFLGLPLFPGTSEYNQITRIVEMLGMPPDHMLQKGKQTSHFFEPFQDDYGRQRWRLKSLERYAAEFKVQEQPSKKYFAASSLPEIISQYPIGRKGYKEAEIDKERKNRMAFIDFVQGLLQLDPELRWSPQQARLHPFVLGEPFTTPFIPPIPKSGGFSTKPPLPNAPQPEQKRYGGLPPTPQRSSTRTYQDAKAYNQHLAQQQGYTTQAQQAAQRAALVPTNPYQDAPAQSVYGASQRALPMQQPQQMSMLQQQQAQVAQQQHAQQQQQQAQAQAQAQAHAQQAYAYSQQQQQQRPPNQQQQQPQQQMQMQGGQGALVANPPAVHHYTTRGRSNTLVAQDLPPALLKLGPNLLNSGSGQSITPVLRREDQAQAWERMQSVGGGVQRRVSIGRNPHLSLLQEQAESGVNSWQSPLRAKIPQPTYSYYQSPVQQQSFSVVVDPRDRQQQQDGGGMFDPSGSIAAPPQAYSNIANPSRYASFSGQPPPSSSSSSAQQGYGGEAQRYDGGGGGGGGELQQYQPMQPFQVSPAIRQGQQQGGPPPASLYGSAVPAQHFPTVGGLSQQQKAPSSSMDVWRA